VSGAGRAVQLAVLLIGGDRRVRLTWFAADNLLSFRHVELGFDNGLTVIVGPNGAGTGAGDGRCPR